MNRDKLAKAITIVFMTGAVALLVARRAALAPPLQAKRTPQDAICAMVDAAKAGDSKAYVSQYAGPMQASLRQIEREKGAAGFSQYLRSSTAGIKGVAISGPAHVSDREAWVRIEYVYQDRQEAQTAYLEKVSGEWKITRMEGTERVKTPVPYGTPVQ